MIRDVKGPTRSQPFEIVGSGFCVHEKGVVVTCRHVLERFLEKNVDEQIASISDAEKGKPVQTIGNVKAVQPFALFYVPNPKTQEVIVACAGLKTCIASTEMDVCVALV